MSDEKQVAATAANYQNIPQHEHSRSLYVHCLSCHSFGIDMPMRFISAAQCGNCGSMETVKYYPSCCIVADRTALMAENADLKSKLNWTESDVYARGRADAELDLEILTIKFNSLKAEAVKLAAVLSMCDPLPNLTDFHVLDELKYGQKTREAGKSRDIRSALKQWQAFLDEKG